MRQPVLVEGTPTEETHLRALELECDLAAARPKAVLCEALLKQYDAVGLARESEQFLKWLARKADWCDDMKVWLLRELQARRDTMMGELVTVTDNILRVSVTTCRVTGALATALTACGRIKDAASKWRERLDCEVLDAEEWTSLADFVARFGFDAPLCDAVRDHLHALPERDRPTEGLLLACMLAAKSDPALAGKRLSRLVPEMFADPTLAFHMALTAFSLGEFERALQAIRCALDGGHDEPEWRSAARTLAAFAGEDVVHPGSLVLPQAAVATTMDNATLAPINEIYQGFLVDESDGAWCTSLGPLEADDNALPLPKAPSSVLATLSVLPEKGHLSRWIFSSRCDPLLALSRANSHVALHLVVQRSGNTHSLHAFTSAPDRNLWKYEQVNVSETPKEAERGTNGESAAKQWQEAMNELRLLTHEHDSAEELDYEEALEN